MKHIDRIKNQNQEYHMEKRYLYLLYNYLQKALFLTIILTMKYLLPASFSFPCLLAVFLTSLFVHFALFYFFLPISLQFFTLFFVYFLLSPLPFNSILFKPFSNTFHIHNACCTQCFHPSIDLYLQTLQTKNKVKFLYPAVVRRWQC